MKIDVQQQRLASMLTFSNRIAAAKTTLPILSNVLLATDNGRLKLLTTNLEVSLAGYMGAHVEKEGEATVPTNLLHNYIQSISPEKLTFEVKENVLSVKGTTTSAEFLTMPAVEFPEFPNIGEEVLFRLSPLKLQDLLKKLLFAAATNDTRPVLTGVLFRGTPEGIILVATDGFRLAEITVDWETLGAEPPQESFEMIIPSKMLKDIGQFSSESGQDEMWDVRFTADKNQIVFVSSDIQLFARLIEAEFPQYDNIIPKEHNTVVEVERDALVNAVKTASLFAHSQSHTVQVDINETAQAVKIFAESKERGRQETTLPVNVKGESMQAGFNASYLTDAVSAFETNSVELRMKASESPALFVSPEDNEHTIRQVVMPIRLEVSS